MIRSITNMAVAHSGTAVLLASQSQETITSGLLLDMAGHHGDTYRHQIRVAEFTAALLLSGASGIPESQYGNTVTAALVHDYGKIAISPAVLDKPGKLTADEWAEMQDHPVNGFLAILKAGLPLDVAATVIDHHTWQDNDYPSVGGSQKIIQATNHPKTDEVLADPFLPRRTLVIAIADQHDARYPGNRAYATEDYLAKDLTSVVLGGLMEAGKARTTYARYDLSRTMIDLCGVAEKVLCT